uniref:Inhibitor of nuclear factor kappa-B kinase subunit alpha n=1 Tax=Esox lucius TaxID=8010 RepID=A0A6Q2WS94_ESOLU
MDKTPFRNTPNCGDWELKERLGMGGFAHVYLYQHNETSEKIAVKMCRLDLTPRNKDRWSREIQIMKKLNNLNVVTARDVPEEMKHIALNDLPLLAMEYCSKGDLRKMLSKPENCCGLKESEVLSLLNDVGSGIQYLHENKIIHRDLKPENIVLQDIDGKLVHKIIDLGYAKDLDQGSLCTSFVGTLQYLAPELFENKPYTVTVDYWSFGTMIFECSCGFRPFLHNLQPVQWYFKVRNKGPKDIMAVEELNGEVRFSTHLPYPNNLSSTLLESMEMLLQLMLKWDPVQRGGKTNPDSKKPQCFEVLEQILCMKVVHILNMTTAQVHSFQLDPDESLHSLQRRIEKETKIELVNQELLQETGVSLDPRKPAAHFSICSHHGLVEEGLHFVVLSHKFQVESCFCCCPPVREAKSQLPLVVLKKVWAEAVSYICGLKEDYSRLFQGQRAAMLSLLRYNTNLTRCKNGMFAFSQQLKAKLDFFKSSIQYDLEKYSDQMHYGICKCLLASGGLWPEEEARSVSHLDEEIMSLHSEIVELQRSPYARRQGDTEMPLIELYMILCIWLPFYAAYFKTLVFHQQCVLLNSAVWGYGCLFEFRPLLYSCGFPFHFHRCSKILLSKQKIIDLFPRIEKTLENIKEADNTVMQMQIKRQREFWHLLKIACNSARNSITASPESSNPMQVSQWTQPISTPHPLTSLPGPNDRSVLYTLDRSSR